MSVCSSDGWTQKTAAGLIATGLPSEVERDHVLWIERSRLEFNQRLTPVRRTKDGASAARRRGWTGSRSGMISSRLATALTARG